MPIASRRALLALAAIAVLAACAPKAGGAYGIFFKDESATLTPAAQKLIADAAAEAKNWNPKSISVDGFAGTAGPRDTHEALSVKRAETVAAALVADGVPSTLIHRVEGHGDAGALPGVTVGERRVEIKLNY
jgi:outer membrane protein OmpA-like peptidoglycan-associated protein